VGPRAFDYGETLYGRDRELTELLDLLIAERIVLLYSPSGAGKTSLIQAGLIGQLREEGFRVQPIIRVSHEPGRVHPLRPVNRYLMSTLLSLEEGVPAHQQQPLERLAAMGLSEYLDRQTTDQRWEGEVLIFDQFEELLTLDPTDEAVKAAFLDELGAALRSLDRWALFVMREDFIAGLDPYLRHVPTRLATTFRLDLLREGEARTAIIRPAQAMGVRFSESAAQKLVDDLRRVRIQRPHGSTEELGPYIEPVQLQVVCRALWERLPAMGSVIEDSDVHAVGDVDSALAAYYAEQVTAVAAKTGASERAIRDWVDRKLITAQGFRTQVLEGPEGDYARDGETLRLLLEAHLLRAENRRGATWFELAHDRLIEPLRASNAAWREAKLNAIQRRAAVWDSTDRPPALLLTGEALHEAERWAAENEEGITAVEESFLDASRAARTESARRRLRWVAALASVVSLVTVTALVFALLQGSAAHVARQRAEAQALAAEAVDNLSFDSDLSLLLALEAVAKAPSIDSSSDARAALYRAIDASAVATRLPEHNVYRLAFSPDGSRMVTVSTQRTTATVWDVPSRGKVSNLRGHEKPVLAAAFSPDGARLATTSHDGTALVWDAASGRILHTLRGGSGIVSGVSFSPDGRLVTASAGDVAQIWEVESGELLRPLEGHNGWVRDVAFSPDGAQVATVGDDGTLRLWDPRSGASLRVLRGHVGPVYRVVFSPDGSRLATCGMDGTARVWDRVSGAELPPLIGHTREVTDVAFSRDGRLATASKDETAGVWEPSSGQRQLTLNSQAGPVTSVAFSPDGSVLAVAAADGPPSLFDLASYLARRESAHLATVSAVDFRPDGQRLATASLDGTAKIWDAATGKALLTLRGPGGAVLDVAFSHDGTRAVTAGSDGTSTVWNAETGEADMTLQGGAGSVTGVAFSPDGSLVTGSANGATEVWDGASGRRLRVLSPHGNQVNDVAFSLDGRRVASALNDGTAVVWDSPSWRPRHVVEAHFGPVKALAFSSDGALLATAGADETAKVWDLTSGSLLLTLNDHTGWVSDVAFSPDDRQLITASSDRTVRMWDLASQQERLRIPEDAPVSALALRPDGRTLATVVGTGYSLRNLDSSDLSDLARSRLHRWWRPEECKKYLQTAECPPA
jgi:WD40 repeat protein